jgi:hypothetical protein
VSTPRYWTVDEARAALPRMRELLGALQRMASLATRVRSNGHAVMGGTPSPQHPSVTGSISGSASGSASSGSASFSSSPGGIQPVLEELEELGIVLRDPSRGLIDFPAMHLGRVVHLCWQLGEDDLDWWHFPDDGFAGRQPLPLPFEWWPEG